MGIDGDAMLVSYETEPGTGAFTPAPSSRCRVVLPRLNRRPDFAQMLHRIGWLILTMTDTGRNALSSATLKPGYGRLPVSGSRRSGACSG